MKNKHKLKIISFHDAQAECVGCSWYFAGTGERTLDEIETLYSLQKGHKKTGASHEIKT